MQTVILKNKAIETVQKGCPWLYTGAIVPPANPIVNGSLVQLVSLQHKPMGVAYYNAKSKLICRILSREADITIDESFFIERFKTAFAYRDRLFSEPYYRLIHAEGDRLPGLIIDRFDDVYVCQTSTLGMEQLKEIWLKALIEVAKPKAVIFKDDVVVRKAEGLALDVRLAYGNPLEEIKVVENDCIFYIHPFDGQKTGWFFDQRANRRWIQTQATDKTVLDLYSYCGGFGINALQGGATSVTFVDRSQEAIVHIEQALTHFPGVETQCVKMNAYDFLNQAIEAGQTFDLVIADPPAFVKSKADVGPGLKGYEKLARLCAQVVAPNGQLLIASCSHHAALSQFKRAVEAGIHKADKNAECIYQAQADKDHPVHPQLKQTRYLKALGYIF